MTEGAAIHETVIFDTEPLITYFYNEPGVAPLRRTPTSSKARPMDISQ